jgi:hypothetical protein
MSFIDFQRENLISALTIVAQLINVYWWVPLPFFLWRPFKFLWLWWRVDGFLSKQSAVMLEIRLPKELLKPIRAMEVVLSSILAAAYQPPDLWEKWIDGQVQLSVGLEIASINGEPHFFIRTPKPYRDAVESSLYAQYPEIEIKEVDDYTKYVPRDLPNKEWDMFGSDYKLAKPDFYPIKTYLQFETEQEALEKKRIDPIAGLMESMAKIKEGEQLWIQFLITPIADADEIKFLNQVTTKGSLSVWRKKGEVLRDKLARRDEDAGERSMLQKAFDIMILNKVEEEKKEKSIIPPEMKLTPGEREVLGAIEMKMSKPIFDCTVRFIYLGKRDVWFKPNFRLAFSYFNQYTTSNLNALYPVGRTLTKIKKFFILRPLNATFIRERRHYLRCRKLFRNYVDRLSPFFPKPGGTFKLNTEELASLYHFPSWEVSPVPGVPRLDSKKGPAPELPVE